MKKNTNSFITKNIGGFTLIEMLVVVAIIGLLSSTVLVGLTDARKRARDSRRISDVREIQNGLQHYNIEKSTFPREAEFYNNVIPNLPEDPRGGKYGYIRITSEAYVLGACLETDRGTEVSSFVPANADEYDVSPIDSPLENPPLCTCADQNAYCVAFGIGGR